jgi:hypothetical protein
LLPSEVVQRGDTLDVLVSETAMAWHRKQRELAESKVSGKAPPAPKLTLDQMKSMIEKARSER